MLGFLHFDRRNDRRRVRLARAFEKKVK